MSTRYENSLVSIGKDRTSRCLSLAFSIHTFHGNGFVRSVDLLVLPNINPDAAFGIQVAIEDTLAHYKSATFQVALLYTSSKGERRIRVHTLSLPISSSLNEVFANADQEAVVSTVAKMGKIVGPRCQIAS